MAKTQFHIIIESEEELLLQRDYYTDMRNKHQERLTALEKEMNQLRTANANYTKMISRINEHLALPPEPVVVSLAAEEPTIKPAAPPPIEKDKPKPLGLRLFENADSIKPAATENSVPKPAPVNKPANEDIKAQALVVYDINLTKAQKSEYALRKIGKAASTREILNVLISNDADLISRAQTTFDKYQKALAATLFQKVELKNTFFSVREENTVKYGLLEWNKK
jgi:hypothetical protein